MSVDSREKQQERKAKAWCRPLSRNLRRVALFILYAATALSWCQVWWLIAWCRSSWNWSEVIFKRAGGPGQQSRLVWRPHPPPAATPERPRVLFHLLSGGKRLFRLWFLLLLVQALSGGLHEARQAFARQRLALVGGRESEAGEGDSCQNAAELKVLKAGLQETWWMVMRQICCIQPDLHNIYLLILIHLAHSAPVEQHLCAAQAAEASS